LVEDEAEELEEEEEEEEGSEEAACLDFLSTSSLA